MYEIKWIESKFFSENKIANQMIIIHHTGSLNDKIYSIQSTIDWFQPKVPRRINKVSAHYIIPRNEGAIIQMVRDEHTAWHAGKSEWIIEGTSYADLNNRSIGIELQGDGNLVSYTDFQYGALAWLLKQKMEEFSISFELVQGHMDISPIRKMDPGYLFDRNRLYMELGLRDDLRLMENYTIDNLQETNEINMSSGLTWLNRVVSFMGWKI